MHSFSLAQPQTITEAIAATAQPDAKTPDAKIIAGGTDLMQLMKDNVERPDRLIDIAGLPLGGVEVTAQGLRMGALAHMAEVADHPDVRRDYPAIAQALAASASGQVRNMATIGGNILQRTRCGYFRDTAFACNKRVRGSGCPAQDGENRFLAILGTSDHCVATHASDFAVALAALDAEVELQGPAGPRRVALTEFHRVPGDTPEVETIMLPGELITAITVPASRLARNSHYLKVRDRASFEWALISAAVALDIGGGRIRAARVAMGGVGTKPWRLPQVEAALIGAAADETGFRAAAAHAADGARPLNQNGFKLTLMRNTLVRALQATAATI
ncbi:MAG TPA: xanthine dehydrogenase family protein subunit M [Stellaceae bacterium]|nr:xanthine dehydrogenase family protein subunit M [Stellaceae bacterium]